MCGILAILNSSLHPEELRTIGLSLAKRIRHRGPDWSGIHIQKLPDGSHHLFCHERLAIVDPASGKQPLFDSTKKICAIVNAEIYNHEDLRKELDPVDVSSFASQSDCQVIPYLFKKFGNEMVSKLDGMFTFVVSNEETGDYIIGRDWIGICSLYIGYSTDGSIWVSSELKAIKDNCPHLEIFPPGNYYSSQLNDGKGGFQRYFNPSWYLENALTPSSRPDLGVFRNALEDAVEKRLMSDVPFGVLLSGGLDSSLIASICCRKQKELIEKGRVDPSKRLWFKKVHSFSIGLPGSSDLVAARKVAEYLGTAHHEFSFELQEGIDALEDVIWHLETYDVTTIRAATPMYFLSRLIKSLGIKVVLSGEGADEVFGGYLYFHKAPNKDEFFRETVRKIKSLHTYDLLRANKSTMAWGLEVRVPFLDMNFVDQSMKLDPAEKMCKEGRIEKSLLREAFNGYLPDDILWRQKEQFSDGVGYGWIDGLKEFAEKKISNQIFDQAKLLFPFNTPQTKEAYLYRSIFYKLFPQSCAAETVPGGPSIACSTAAAIEWDESFKKNADQSGRSVLGIHSAAIQFKDLEHVVCN